MCGLNGLGSHFDIGSWARRGRSRGEIEKKGFLLDVRSLSPQLRGIMDITRLGGFFEGGNNLSVTDGDHSSTCVVLFFLAVYVA